MWGGEDDGHDYGDGGGAFSIIEEAVPNPGDNPTNGNITIWNSGASLADLGMPWPPIGSNSDNGFYPGATIGYAVDTRDKSVVPTVYVFVPHRDTGETNLIKVFRLWMSHCPLYPVAYCNSASYETTGFDVTLNGGNTPFVHDPRPLLEAAGVDVSDFDFGWTDSEIRA